MLSIGLAFFFGYSLDDQAGSGAGVPFRVAIKVALAADTLVDPDDGDRRQRRAIVAVPGAMDAGLASLLFWGSLAFSLVVAFVVTVPVNRWLIGRGKGHAVMHDTTDWRCTRRLRS